MIPNSVSAIKQRRRPNFPLLPPELWVIIFHHATHVPGIFIPEIYKHSDTLGSIFDHYHHPLIRHTLLTKRYLVRVCKQWWHLATPFLYRSIFIARARCLSSLATTLTLSALGKTVLLSAIPLGSYTERLDITMRTEGQPDGDRDFELLARIIRCLKNISVVSVHIKYHRQTNIMPDVVMDALTHASPTLKIIDWAASHLFPSSHSFHNLINATQLHMLSCPYVLAAHTEPTANYTLSSCTMLDMTSYRIFHLMSSSQLPALRELRCHSIPPRHFSSFLQTHGEKLHSVHLDWSLYSNIPHHFRLLAEHCPNLRRLTLTLDSWEFLDADTLKLIPVQYLGLACRKTQSPTLEYKFAFFALLYLQDMMPTLRVVRFIDFSAVRELLNNHRKLLVHALELFHRSDFHLEDHEGRLLSDQVVL